MTDYPPEALDRDVKRYLELDELAKEIASEQAGIKARLRSLGEGDWEAPCGVQVVVSPPNRTFDLGTAVKLLSPEALDQCRAEGYDAAKVKRFLPPALLDVAMLPGKGEPRVVVK
jgi:hypothetical protein